MTKVLGIPAVASITVALSCMISAALLPCALAQVPTSKPAEELYLQLGRLTLDPARVYKVRDASLDRASIHISLEDGTIAFTEDVMGRVTGAFFVGDGEVLLSPPTAVERKSMSLFTGMAILEEHFASAYFRFNDDLPNELRSGLRAPENPQEFVTQWGNAAQLLAQPDAMRLLVSFSRLLPIHGAPASSESPTLLGQNPDHFLHARLQGIKLGVFDLLYDSLASEQVQAGQAKAEGTVTYYDVWTSFSPVARPRARDANGSSGPGNPSPREDWIAARHYTIKTEVQPPKLIHSQARVDLQVKEGGTRAVLFELSRFLQVDSVKVDGQPVEFIHNPAMEGTQLSRRGNDIVAVILLEPARVGQNLNIEFAYGGEVLAEAGNGLVYVGARGTWYPNRGMAMADFDLEFTYPQGWTLVATGKPEAPTSASNTPAVQTSRWISDRPIPIAGFNLGKYKEATALAGSVPVGTFATSGVERDFPSSPIEVVTTEPLDPRTHGMQVIMPPTQPSPAQNEVSVGEAAARAIQFYSARFGSYPYSRLSLTQMPGPDSQGWPSLVFLSSYAFLTDQEREQLHFGSARIALQKLIPAHETAHQWWGDLVTWSTYRDQWLSEGLANYCALMTLEDKNPALFRQIMDMYRNDLLATNKDGMSPADVGPVTLGTRLLSSKLPAGYEAITYGRGAWLFHMLRTMLNDAREQETSRKRRGTSVSDDLFTNALREIRRRYEGKSISTRELLDVFAEKLPPSLRYEGKDSLDWFLEGWINGTSLPKLELKTVKFTPKATGVTVSATILQREAPPDLVTSVPVYAVVAGRQPVLLGRVFADGEESSFHLAAPSGTHKIVLDPYQTILTSPK